MKKVYIYHPQPFICTVLINSLTMNFPSINFKIFDVIKNRDSIVATVIFLIEGIDSVRLGRIKYIRQSMPFANFVFVTAMDESLIRNLLVLKASDVVFSGLYEWSELLKEFRRTSFSDIEKFDEEIIFSNVDSLTKRQNQLLILLSLGKSNLEIANILNIKDATVKVHLSRLYKKLHVRSRMQAVIAGRKFGFISA